MGCEDGSIVHICAEYCFGMDVGRSVVYIVYSSGTRMLPWGTPESIGNRDEVSLLNVVVKYLSCR
jgi:hypothetical protein